ncbi:uncharacterized protein LOC136086917 [Hydra vulgaris]|uniref:Uncharacterized protein LOC136086917 n=1 Tax=Hydra vulgaris TaxID=6087 RepID=A0ABM4CU74_HYDVU
MPKTGSGNTNDDNTARRAFKNSEVFSEITKVDYLYCTETAKRIVSLYDWYVKPPTVHKLLLHSSSISHKLLLPIGLYSEDSLESLNKQIRNSRLKHTAKISRLNTMMNQMHYLLKNMSILEGQDRRRYNEVAVVFVGEDGAPPASREVVIYPRGHPLKTISSVSANLDPIKSLSQYYNYKLSVRRFFSSHFYGKKLFQQYAVDAYVKIEGQRLAFIRNNQNKLRSEQYDVLHEHVNNIGNDHNVRPGRVVVLPSTYAGSPRALKENFEDAMAITKKYGKPDLFTTFTCNPTWREITENLYPVQTANDRPDLVIRVFKLKLNNLLNDIFKHGVLGKVVTHVQVIEFQKRGLPHVHILLHFANDDKLETAHDIKNLISSEIPNPIVNRDLYDVVKTCMIHGP